MQERIILVRFAIARHHQSWTSFSSECRDATPNKSFSTISGGILCVTDSVGPHHPLRMHVRTTFFTSSHLLCSLISPGSLTRLFSIFGRSRSSPFCVPYIGFSGFRFASKWWLVSTSALTFRGSWYSSAVIAMMSGIVALCEAHMSTSRYT